MFHGTLLIIYDGSVQQRRRTMSEGNFEVMPLGTMEEVREMRRLSKELIALDSAYVDSMPYAVRQKIGEIARFYQYHAQKFPVIV
jgi:hypothetical protein